jgi:5-formyltetrahydrofolate cyclo-ligase
MTKQESRALYKQKRLALSFAEKDKLEDLMLIQFQKLKVELPKHVLTYKPIDKNNEYDPYLVECYHLFKNRDTIFYYPKIDLSTNDMNAFEGNVDTVFEKALFDIDEPITKNKINPIDVQMIFVPLLCFNEDGYRVGYGKGYYDAYIKNCNKDVIIIGFSFFDAVQIDDVNSNDEQMDFCITPYKTYTFKK